MRIISFAKILIVTIAFVSAAALPWSGSATAAMKHAMKLPPGASTVEKKKAVNTGTICSFQCNAGQLVRAAALQQRCPRSGPALLRPVLRCEMRGLSARF